MIRPARTADLEPLAEMRHRLWPDGSLAEHRDELGRFFAGTAGEPLEILVAEGDERLLGFCELSIRPYAEGCATNRVGYLEGWYVEADARRSGVGRALFEGGEDWARAQGCREFASDAELDNEVSRAAHLALGFSEAGVVRCFRKDL